MIARLLFLFVLALAWTGCRPAAREVVVYCAQDQVYAEPLFQKFTAESGIRVKPLYDSEAVKTVGLANRLLAERKHPRADLFWGNEEFRARQLERQGVFAETRFFGHRTRRVVVHTSLKAEPPIASLLELTNAAWRGRVAVAYPMFGTTATHLHALRQYWGDALWETWCRGLLANEPLLLDGNSQVVKAVGSGRATIGLTDSDDILAGQREQLPVASWPLTADTLVIPNALGIARGGPNLEGARQLAVYLEREAQQLVAAGALEGAGTTNAGLQPRWDELLQRLPETNRKLEELFLR